MAVPSPSSKAQIRADALEERRDFARALTPALRADLEAKLARIALDRMLAVS